MRGVVIEPSAGRAFARVIDVEPCGRCRDRGMVEVAGRDGVLRAARCRCRRIHDAAATWNTAGVPASHAAASLVMGGGRSDHGPVTGAHRSVASWLHGLGEGGEGGVLLHGAPGTGKTWLAIAALRWLTFERAWPRPARFVDVDRYIADYKASFDQGGEGRTGPTLERLGSIDVLVLDDLNGTGSEFDRRIADDLISRRTARAGITIITSNRSPQQLAEAFTDRLASRLEGLCSAVHLQGPDRRRSATRIHGVVQ